MRNSDWLWFVGLASLSLLAGCSSSIDTKIGDGTRTARELRQSHKTQLTRTVSDSEPLGQPESDAFSLVQYPSDSGELSAWISKPTATDGNRQPAMLWVTGGFPPGGIDSSAWEPVPRGNDQSAKAYREAGFVMMYPTLRGSFGNPGSQEGFFGEVDDVIAAIEYVKTLDHIDHDRVYLGGHSTGGTLVLLVAAVTDELAGAISFGPVEDPAFYGAEYVYHAYGEFEAELRAPIKYINEIKTPTIVLEGGDGNASSLAVLQRASTNPNVSFVLARKFDHFSILAPANAVLAKKLTNAESGQNLSVTEADIR